MSQELDNICIILDQYADKIAKAKGNEQSLPAFRSTIEEVQHFIEGIDISQYKKTSIISSLNGALIELKNLNAQNGFDLSYLIMDASRKIRAFASQKAVLI